MLFEADPHGRLRSRTELDLVYFGVRIGFVGGIERNVESIHVGLPVTYPQWS